MAEDGHNPLYSSRLRSAADWHVSYVLNDPQFKRGINLIRGMEKRAGTKSEHVERMKQRLARRFGLEASDINLALLPLYLENRKRKTKMTYNHDTDRWSISFDMTTTKAELLEEWEQFERYKKLLGQTVPTKRKPPENPSLLYAMFKARKRSETFGKIFDLYSNGKLPGYTGSTTQFNSEDSLERYYQRYYPKDIPAT